MRKVWWMCCVGGNSRIRIMKTTATLTVHYKRHSYSLEKQKDGTIRVVCKSANINQDFLAEDVSDLLLDLPQLIVAEQKYKEGQGG